MDCDAESFGTQHPLDGMKCDSDFLPTQNICQITSDTWTSVRSFNFCGKNIYEILVVNAKVYQAYEMFNVEEKCSLQLKGYCGCSYFKGRI